MNRDELLSAVSDLLGTRKLVWAGIRGEDIESIADLPQLSASFSIVGGYRRRSSIDGMALEDLMGRRVDLEVWDIDNYRHDEPVVEFRRSLLRALSQPSALLPYRPSRFLSAIWFARRDRCLHLGLFGAHQFAFEHKPWVETSVSALGVPTIPWVYIADEEQLLTVDILDKGPVMLRLSRTSGGEGIVKIDSAADLKMAWPDSEEAFVCVAPFLPNVLPINVGGTVWHDGVTVGYPSIQLVGIPDCVTRPFGYCGNDFGRARDLDPKVLDDIDAHTTKIGNWLRTMGYLGTFGVDYLLDERGDLYFTEINPRFQGSTVASGRIAVQTGMPCLLLEHLAATLGMPCPPIPPFKTRVREMPALAQLIVHWTGPAAAMIDPEPLHQLASSVGGSADVSTRPTLLTDRGGAATRITFWGPMTKTGFDLLEPFASTVGTWRQAELALTEKRNV